MNEKYHKKLEAALPSLGEAIKRGFRGVPTWVVEVLAVEARAVHDTCPGLALLAALQEALEEALSDRGVAR